MFRSYCVHKVHDLVDTVTAEHYLVRAHVWPSMRGDLPHNVVVVLSLISGAVIHASCEPCRVSSLGRCSHVVAVLFTVLDHTQKHGYVASKPCTSQECSWNKGKKRNKTPQRLSQATYDSKLKKAAVQVIDFDPRPAKHRVVAPEHINRFEWTDVSIEEEVGSGTFCSVFGSVKPKQVHYHPKLSCIHLAHRKKFHPTVELTHANRDMMDDIHLQHLTT